MSTRNEKTMEQADTNFARTQADGLDNVAPTIVQGQAAWQYAQSDNFLSPEERTAVLRQSLEPYRTEIEAKLTQVGWEPAHLAKYPDIERSLFSGQQSSPMEIWVGTGLKMEGSLRIVMTDSGPDLRITPVAPALSIPQEIAGIKLSIAERQQLADQGALPRPFLVAENGQFVPTFLRIDEQTNTLELWRVKPEQLPTKLMGIDLTKDQQLQLVSGHAVRLTGLIDQQGEAFNATVSISAAKQQLQFSEFNRLDVALKPDNQYSRQLAQNNEGAKTDLTRSQETASGLQTSSNSQRETVQKLLEGKQDHPSTGQRVKIH